MQRLISSEVKRCFQLKVWVQRNPLESLHTCAYGNGLVSQEELLQTPAVIGPSPWAHVLALRALCCVQVAMVSYPGMS